MFAYLAVSERKCIIYRPDLIVEAEISISVKTKNMFRFDC